MDGIDSWGGDFLRPLETWLSEDTAAWMSSSSRDSYQVGAARGTFR